MYILILLNDALPNSVILLQITNNYNCQVFFLLKCDKAIKVISVRDLKGLKS